LGATAILTSLGKMVVCAAAMAAACAAALRFSHFEALEHFTARAGILVAMMALSVGVYFALAKALRCEELPELFLLLRRAEPEALGLSIDV